MTIEGGSDFERLHGARAQAPRFGHAVSKYVGDSLSRDVRMAKSAGLWTAWARYGTVHDPRDWQRVVDVSPWTAVQRAQACVHVPEPETTPDVVLQRTFEELLEHFDFGRGLPTRRPTAELAAL